VNLKERALLSLKTMFYTETGMKARSCMTPFVDKRSACCALPAATVRPSQSAVEFRYDDEGIVLVTPDQAAHLAQRNLVLAAVSIAELDPPV
jgi:hypothetical protein